MPQPAGGNADGKLVTTGHADSLDGNAVMVLEQILARAIFETCLVSSVGVSKAKASLSCSRKALGRLVISSNEQTFFSKTHSMSCFARKAGWPSSATSSRISFLAQVANVLRFSPGFMEAFRFWGNVEGIATIWYQLQKL